MKQSLVAENMLYIPLRLDFKVAQQTLQKDFDFLIGTELLQGHTDNWHAIQLIKVNKLCG